MARPVSLMSAALVTAAASGLLPQMAPWLSSSPPANLTLTQTAPGAPPAPFRPGTATPLSIGGQLRDLGSGVSVMVPVQALRFEWHGKSVNRPLLFVNDGSTPREVALDVRMLGIQEPVLFRVNFQGRCVTAEHPGFTLAPHSNEFIYVKLQLSKDSVIPSTLPATGILKIRLLEKTQGEPVKQEITIPEAPVPGVPGTVFVGALVMAAMIVLITMYSLESKGINLLWLMGSPTWNFQQSWAANVTIAATFLGIVLNLSLFPEHPFFMPKASYMLLQTLFAAILGLAPLAYTLIRRDIQVVVGGMAGVDTQGYVITFLISGGIVLWGALGQALTLSLLVTEFLKGNTIDVLIGRVLEGLTIGLCLLLVVYGLRSLYKTAKRLSAPPARAAGVQPPSPHFSPGAALPANIAQRLQPPLPAWPLL